MSIGIVMEIHRNYTIVLTRDGSFEKAIIADKDAVVGEEVKFEPYVNRKFLLIDMDNKRSLAMKVFSIAALVAIFLFSTFYLVGENRTYAYVTIDINPSIELEVNKSLQVQNITAINADAEKLLQSLSDYKQEDLQTVIDEIMRKSKKQNMTNEAKNMLIGVSYANEPQREIVQSMNQYFNAKTTEWEIVIFNVPSEVRQKAIVNNISMNEELAILIGDKNSAIDKMKIDEKKIDRIHSFYYQDDETKEVDPIQKLDKQSNTKTQEKQEAPPEIEKTDASTSRNEEQSNGNNNHENVDSKLNNKTKNESHPSELKKENGEINSEGENVKKKEENSKNNNIDDKHKDKPQSKKETNDNNEHGMQMKKDNSNKDKSTDDHEGKNQQQKNNKDNSKNENVENGKNQKEEKGKDH